MTWNNARPIVIRPWLRRISSYQWHHYHHHKEQCQNDILPRSSSVLHGIMVPSQNRTNVNDEPNSTIIMLRRFSTDGAHHDPTMRERATEHARNSAKVACKGAKSAKEMMKQYGPVFIGTYISLYWTVLALLYGGVDSGMIDPLTMIQYMKNAEDTQSAQTTVQYVVAFMQHYSITAPYAPYVAKNPHFANLGVAWIGVKFTEPVRLPLAISITPRVARYFGRGKKDDDDTKLDNPAETEFPNSAETAPPNNAAGPEFSSKQGGTSKP